MKDIQASWQKDSTIQQLIREIEGDPASHPEYSWRDKYLRRKGKLVVGFDRDLRKKIISWYHGSAQGGHSGVTATWKRLVSIFYLSGIRRDVAEFIKLCSVSKMQCRKRCVSRSVATVTGPSRGVGGYFYGFY